MEPGMPVSASHGILASPPSSSKKRSSLHMQDTATVAQAQPHFIPVPRGGAAVPVERSSEMLQSPGDTISRLLATSDPGQILSTAMRWYQSAEGENGGDEEQDRVMPLHSTQESSAYASSSHVPSFQESLLHSSSSNSTSKMGFNKTSLHSPPSQHPLQPPPAPSSVSLNIGQTTSKRRRGVSTSAITGSTGAPSIGGRSLLSRARSPTMSLHEDFEGDLLSQMQVKERLRRDSHNIVEQRRRNHINNEILEIQRLLPESSFDDLGDARISQGLVLVKAVEYIREQAASQELRTSWETVITTIGPLLELIRVQEQQLLSRNVRVPQRSSELLQQMNRLISVVNSTHVQQSTHHSQRVTPGPNTTPSHPLPAPVGMMSRPSSSSSSSRWLILGPSSTSATAAANGGMHFKEEALSVASSPPLPPLVTCHQVKSSPGDELSQRSVAATSSLVYADLLSDLDTFESYSQHEALEEEDESAAGQEGEEEVQESCKTPAMMLDVVSGGAETPSAMEVESGDPGLDIEYMADWDLNDLLDM